jgi:hypothetical protein
VTSHVLQHSYSRSPLSSAVTSHVLPSPWLSMYFVTRPPGWTVDSDALDWTQLSSHQSQSKRYDATDGQPVRQSWSQAPIWDDWQFFLFYLFIFRPLQICWNEVSSLTRGLDLTLAVGTRQSSLSTVRVPRGSWTYFTFSNFIFSQPGAADYNIYIYMYIYISKGENWPSSSHRQWVYNHTEVTLKVILWPTVSRPFCLRVSRPSRTVTYFLLFL